MDSVVRYGYVRFDAYRQFVTGEPLGGDAVTEGAPAEGVARQPG